VKKTGTNTLGYGKTREVVIQGHKQGMTKKQIAEKHGLSRPAVHNCAYRLGLKFEYVKLTHSYGDIKHTVLEAAEKGMTVREISRTYGFRYRTVYGINRNFKLGIKLK
jgi:hypothetical protein